MWTAQIIALPNSLLILQAVEDGEGDVVCEDGLDFSVHALNLPQKPVEHLHVHAPLRRDCDIWVQALHHVRWADNGDIGADRLDFLLADPLSAQTPALGVRVGASC